MARRGSQPQLDAPYDQELHGILLFRSLNEAEIAISRLQQLRLKYLAASDLKGVECCRRVALLGRRRAEFISRDPRVRHAKRREKAEIASWFAIWLETPDLFGEWLALRKLSGSFRELNAELPDVEPG